MTNALTIIHWKHQSIASALHAIVYCVDQMWAHRLASEKKLPRRLRLRFRTHRRSSGASGRIPAFPLRTASRSFPG